jgi:hypothetical protein
MIRLNWEKLILINLGPGDVKDKITHVLFYLGLLHMLIFLEHSTT